MADVDEIVQRCAALGRRAEESSLSLEYEAGQITSLMQRLQASFGDQPAGQEAVSHLYEALKHVLAAGTALRDEKTHGEGFIAKIRS